MEESLIKFQKELEVKAAELEATTMTYHDTVKAINSRYQAEKHKIEDVDNGSISVDEEDAILRAEKWEEKQQHQNEDVFCNIIPISTFQENEEGLDQPQPIPTFQQNVEMFAPPQPIPNLEPEWHGG